METASLDPNEVPSLDPNEVPSLDPNEVPSLSQARAHLRILERDLKKSEAFAEQLELDLKNVYARSPFDNAMDEMFLSGNPFSSTNGDFFRNFMVRCMVDNVQANQRYSALMDAQAQNNARRRWLLEEIEKAKEMVSLVQASLATEDAPAHRQ
jgi:hypothetical protein